MHVNHSKKYPLATLTPSRDVLNAADGLGVAAFTPVTAVAESRTPTTLASFTGADGANPMDGLVADAAGNFFGTTRAGGADGDGAVFARSAPSRRDCSPPARVARAEPLC